MGSTFRASHPADLLKRDETIRQKMTSTSFYWEKPLFDSPYEHRRLRILNSISLAFAGWAVELVMSAIGRRARFQSADLLASA